MRESGAVSRKNNMQYAIATFCYGERYYNQVNRLIDSFEVLEEKPDIFVVTDSPNSILKKDHVTVKHIAEYNAKYTTYANDYFNFDHSVKRFALLHAFENGYAKVIFTDADVVVNPTLYSHTSILDCFSPNSIQSQVTYNFSKEILNSSMLGRRFVAYEEYFGVTYDKSKLDFMPEDCIQYIQLDDEKKFKFIQTWDKCIEIKDTQRLPNAPLGNIDEMCFSALYNEILIGNNANKSLNKLIARHDKWYYLKQ